VWVDDLCGSTNGPVEYPPPCGHPAGRTCRDVPFLTGSFLTGPSGVKLFVYTGVPRTSESVPPIAKTGLLKRTARTLGRAQRPKLILSERDPVARVGSISVEHGRGSGPFQTAKALLLRESHPKGTSSLRSGRSARLVHFGAIKMDIGVGKNLNGWRERTVE
jgi:hypothetical protein